MQEMHIGCSGFNYPHWKGTFYPSDLPQKKWFAFYCSVFSTVELNVTFYRLPKATTFDKWREETPDDFIFSVKGSRFITHIKKLSDPEPPLERFFSNALRLKKKLKVVLWQFPPSFKKNAERLVPFLKLLKRYPVRNTLEFRNESWISPDIVEICREHHVSLCMADAPEFVRDLPVTADFVYIRRHGAGTYDANYTPEQLRADAELIQNHLQKNLDVFIYFNNDIGGYAPRNAVDLGEILKTVTAARS